MTDSASPAFIEVNGSASVSLPSDLAIVSFSVETEAPSAGRAAQENADLMTEVLDALRATGLEALEVDTHGYQLQPVYRGRGEPGEVPRIGGYRAMNQVRARTAAVGEVGQLVDAAIGAGANRVTGLSFAASEPEPARLEALRMAVENARAQAETMADALGMPLGRVLEMRGGADRSPPVQPYLMRAEAAMASTPIEAGDQEVSAAVTIRFALGDGPTP